MYLHSTNRFRTYLQLFRAHKLDKFYLINCNVALNMLDKTTGVWLELL
jgi:hypothetical protein